MKVKLQISNTTKKQFNYIDFSVLEMVLNIILLYIPKASNIDHCDNIKVIATTAGDNRYMFSENTIYILKIGRDTRRELDFLNTFIHEFRHWVQDTLYKVDFYKNYIDCEDSRAAYYKCPIEQDSRKFVKVSHSCITKLYFNLLQLKEIIPKADNTNIKFL